MKSGGWIEKRHGLGSFDGKSFVAKLDRFDGHLIPRGVERRTFYLAGPGFFDLPYHHWFVFFIEKADGEIPTFDIIFPDCIQPLEKLIIRSKNPSFECDIAVLRNAGHFTDVVFQRASFSIVYRLKLYGQAGHFGETYSGTAPLYLKVKDGNWICYCHGIEILMVYDS